jgi:hypothetical protein
MGMQDFAKYQAMGGNIFTSMRPQGHLNTNHQQMLQITPNNVGIISSHQPGGRRNNFDNIK